MRKTYLAILIVFALAGCSKDENTSTPVDPVKPPPTKAGPSDKIVLNEGTYAGDSIKLSWSILDTTAFRSYDVYRQDSPNGQLVFLRQYLTKESVTYTDKNIPYSPSIRYQIFGALSDGNSIKSNVATVFRPNVRIFEANPSDVLYNKTENLLYIIDRFGKISIYDIAQNKITKSINTDAVISYCDFGVFEGHKELYVPRNDGWVFVYDAITLDKLAQINTGLINYSVVYNNNNLYVSTSASFMANPIKVFDRKTGRKISETGEFNGSRLRGIPGSNFDLVEITINVSPVDQNVYKFSPKGGFISYDNDRYHGDYPLDAFSFEVFPDGSRYITSTSGAIYNKDMQYLGSLPRGSLYFNTYAISTEDKLIYAGSQTKNIYAYTLNDYIYTKMFTTQGYPFKLIDIGDQLLCVSYEDRINFCQFCPPTTSPGKIYIEIFNK